MVSGAASVLLVLPLGTASAASVSVPGLVKPAAAGPAGAVGLTAGRPPARVAAAPRPSGGQLRLLPDKAFGAVVVPARGVVHLQVLGRAGVPRSGVAGVLIGLTVAAAKTATSVVAYSTAKPLSGVFPLPANTPGQFQTLVKVDRGGVVTLAAGAAAVRVTVRARGYLTTAVSAADRSGLLHPIPPTVVMDTSAGIGGPALLAGQTRSLDLSKVGGIPPIGVAGVSLTLTETSASKSGSLSVFAAKGKPGPAPDLRFTRGILATTHVVLPVSATGAVKVKAGAGTTNVAVAVDGWYSSKAIPGEAGAGTTLVAPVHLGTRTLRVGVAATVAVAGHAGVPTSSLRPATAAWVLLTAVAAKAAAVVSVRATHDATSPAVAVSVGRGRTVTSLVPVQLGDTGAFDLLGTGGPVEVSVVLLGYASGDVVIQATAKVLTAAAGVLDAVPADGTLTFRSRPTAVAALKAGNVVVFGVTAATPRGLLRRVTSVSRHGAGEIVTTTPATLADAVTSGGGGLSIPTLNMAGATPRSAQPGVRLVPAFGIHHTFDVSLGETVAPGVSTLGDLSVGAGLDLDVQAHLSFSHPITASFDSNVSETLAAGLQVTAQASWSYSHPLLDVDLPSIEFSIGPIPVVVDPSFGIELDTDGTVSATVAAGIAESHSWDAAATYDGQGFQSSTHDTGEPLTHTGPTVSGNVDASVTAPVALTFLFYGVAGPGVQLIPGLRLTGDECGVDLFADLNLKVTLNLSALELGLDDWAHQFPLGEVHLAHISIPCTQGTWTGTITWTDSLHADDPLGSDPQDLAATAIIDETLTWSADVTGKLDPNSTDSPLVYSGLTGSFSYSNVGHDDLCSWSDQARGSRPYLINPAQNVLSVMRLPTDPSASPQTAFLPLTGVGVASTVSNSGCGASNTVVEPDGQGEAGFRAGGINDGPTFAVPGDPTHLQGTVNYVDPNPIPYTTDNYTLTWDLTLTNAPDSDGDGTSDYLELVKFGTDPQDPTSHP